MPKATSNQLLLLLPMKKVSLVLPREVMYAINNSSAK
jgi:hypothetical protein